MAWELAGLEKVCKTFLDGFDSRPRLHIYNLGRKFGEKITTYARTQHHQIYSSSWWRAFWNGVHQELAVPPRFVLPEGEVTKRMLRHQEEAEKAKADLARIRERHIETSRELSRLKRSRGV